MKDQQQQEEPAPKSSPSEQSRDSRRGSEQLEEGLGSNSDDDAILSELHHDDPVEMIRQLRNLRVSGSIGAVARGIRSSQKKISKKTRQVVHGTQERLAKSISHKGISGAPKTHSLVESESRSRSSVAQGVPGKNEKNPQQVPVLEEPTESQPLMESSKELDTQDDPLSSSSPPPRRGKSLWNHLRSHRESLVFHLHSGDSLDSHGEDSETRRSRLVRKYVESIRDSLEFSLFQCVLAILAYLAIAVVAYSFVFEKWSVVDSLYFACVTFSTIGYGDLSPSTNPSRLFTSVFALGGVSCLGVALGVIGSNLIDAQRNAVDHAGELSRYQAMSLFDSTRHGGVDSESSSFRRKDSTATTSPSIPWYRRPFVAQVLPIFSLLFVCSWLLGSKSNWDIVSTFYFTIISACTIGFGDFSPQGQSARLFSVFYIPIAVGAMGHWLGQIASAIIKRRQERFRKEMESHELTMLDIQAMDDNGDGCVTRAEYIEFMLVAMNQVDKELLDDLRAQFDRLDVDGTGVLQRQDLIIVAKKKLQSPRRKLELSNYKKKLLSVTEKNLRTTKRGRFSLIDAIYQPNAQAASPSS